MPNLLSFSQSISNKAQLQPEVELSQIVLRLGFCFMFQLLGIDTPQIHKFSQAKIVAGRSH